MRNRFHSKYITHTLLSSVFSRKSFSIIILISVSILYADSLQRQAHKQFINKQYRKAASTNLSIVADTNTSINDRRYAMQMLGTLYENHLLQFDSAAFWFEQFNEKYASITQHDYYKNKISFLRGLKGNEIKGYSIVQKAIFASNDLQEQVKLLEDGLALAPQLPNRKKVLIFLSQKAYDAGMYAKAYKTMLQLQEMAPGILAGELKDRYSKVRTIYQQSIIARISWAIVILLFLIVIFSTSYKLISFKALKKLYYLIIGWTLFSIILLIIYFIRINRLDHNPFSIFSIFIAIFLLLVITVWIFFARFSLLNRSSYTKTIIVLPLCSFILTLAVWFLFLYYQPERTKILYEFSERYMHWIEGTRKGQKNK